MSEEGPLQSVNITRLRVIYQESKSDARILLALREELRKRRTKNARELLAIVQRQLDRVTAKQRDEMSAGKPTADDTRVSGETGDGAEGPARRVLSSRELAAQKRIADLRMRLLDLSNGNRLLNYKFSNRSRRHVRLVDELPDKILDNLVEGKRLTFKSLPEPDDEPEDEKSDEFLLVLEQAKRSDDEYLLALRNLEDDDQGDVTRRIERALRDRLRKALAMPDRRVRDQIGKAEWARRSGIEPSFDLPIPTIEPKDSYLDGDLQTLLLPEEMEGTLSAINDQARSSLQETGVNTLYLAFGYLEWYEAPNSQTPLYAPLLLHPVDIERKIVAGRYRYSIGSLGEDNDVNITLSERLHQDFHRRLPPLSEEDTPETYFDKVAATIEDIPGWRVRRFAVVGHFAFARLVMFQDLEEGRWPDGIGIIGNPVIAELFAGQGAVGDAFFAEDYEVDQPSIAAKVPLLITDADSSQFSAIVDVMDGKNLAIKGPPGTGKSQTITNIIAAALASAKTVLFVAEKMAALNVVKDRLEKAGLGHFCLELHSTKSRKTDLLQSLERRLDIQGKMRAEGELSGALRELERTRDQLSDYATTINRSFGASGKTIHGILWSEQRTRDNPDGLPDALNTIDLVGAKDMTRHNHDALADKLEVLAGAYAEVSAAGDLADHPWYGIRQPLDYFARERFVEDMKGLSDALRQLAGTVGAIATSVESPVSDTVGDAQDLAEALKRLPAPTGDIDLELYPALQEEESFASLKAFERNQTTWLDAGRRIAESVLNLDAVAHRISELETAASLAHQIDLDDKPVRSLQDQAVTFAAEASLVERTIAFGIRLAEAIGIEKPMTVSQVRKLLACANHAASLASDLRSLRDPGLFDEAALHLLAEGDARARALQRKMTSLSGRLAVGLDGQAHEWRGHAQALRAASFPSRLWRKDVRVAKHRYKGLMRVHAKPKLFEIATDFETIAECIELSFSFSSDVGLQGVCGRHFRGHETPFDRLTAVNSYAISVKRTYSAGDAIDNRIREVLLYSAPDDLARVAALSEDPEAAVVAQALDTFSDPSADLVESLNTLTVRAAKTAELTRHAQSLGLKPDLLIGDIKGVAQAAAARLEAETEIGSNQSARELLGARWHGPQSNRTRILQVLRAASDVDQAMLPAAVRRYLYHAERDTRIEQLKTLQAKMDEALGALQENWRNAAERGNIDEIAFFGSSIRDLAIGNGTVRIARALDAPDQLVVWTAWLVARQDCFENGLGGIIEAFANQPLAASRLSAALDRIFWRTLARAALAEHPVLARFRGLQLENARERFRRLDEEIIQLQRKALAAELCRRPIDPGYKGDYRKYDTGRVLVNHEIGKQKRHIPVRELLDRAGLSIQQMKPCFMMSPLSVAQFLKPERLRFDLVLIDEASQMRPEEALGALARGGQLVVVGDPMQLPPTSFFDRGDRLIEDEIDEEEIVDNESILDLALAEFRPSRSLRWHYRSRHESLIAFSNRQFYNDLIVFPSPLDPDRDKRDPKLGVYHHFVAGKYKGRVNIEEAQHVAEAATAFMAAEPDKSLGIVTLNQTQRDVLLEELERLVPRERSAQKYIERWDETLEPFFVKNLENVQGDERDVIFISTAYGPDAVTGVVMNRFGPINGKHGHRRLNVLFTRAKDRVEVFTSMRPSNIRTDEASQLGARTLKAYLEYAETGKLDAGATSGREPDSEFEELVRGRLQEKGFEVVPQVGVAGYFIDLAVKHPKRSGFVLGIECDGAGYHSSRSARDRDRLRQQVLERLQWNIYRVWSTDWFQNPAQEFRKLLTHLDRLVSEVA